MTATDLSLERIMFGEIRAISNVTRFGQISRIAPENVAEHSYWVAFFAMLIADDVQKGGEIPINWGMLMHRCLLHDMEESITGDFPRPFKYSTEELYQAIETAADKAALKVVEDLSDDLSQREVYHEEWRNAKDQQVEGRIVALADFLSVLQWGLREKALGSRKIAVDLRDLYEYVSQFDHPSFGFLHPYIAQARALTKAVFE
jgi:5'-deoxynucleotidase YfbR-like HD superfamily hydrolase